MDLYLRTSYQLAEQLTQYYSTSFSMSSRLFHRSIRPHIYAIYGMVRLADEIVDTYVQADASDQLAYFQDEVLNAISRGYSTNPIIHAFSHTAQQFSITEELITPFFESMALDLHPQEFDESLYDSYIYGSAEVVGLMCLRVFVGGDSHKYNELLPGARALGAAYQKVNFLRDLKADYEELHRTYFPGIDYATFDESTKSAIIADIQQDFNAANAVIGSLPTEARKAVHASSLYYQALLKRLDHASVTDIKSQRIRVPNIEKIMLLSKASITL